MFGLNDGMRYYVCQRYVRMNLGINGLYKLVSQEMDLHVDGAHARSFLEYKLVSQEMDLPPLSGTVFILFRKNRQ